MRWSRRTPPGSNSNLNRREPFFYHQPDYSLVSRRTYSGQEIVKALESWRFRVVDRSGSHVKLRYKHPDTGEVRNVSVPMHDELATGTLRSIAEQAGANDFQAFLDEIDKMV